MQTHSFTIRGLINDLLRSLSAAMIHIDDLILKLDKTSSEYPEAWLTNEQLQRSVEIFMELRAEAIFFIDTLNSDNNEYYKKFEHITLNRFKHKSNELLTTIWGACDLMLLDNDQKHIMSQISVINKSIKNYIDSNTSIKNELKIMNCHDIKYNENNKNILLVEDEKIVRELTSVALSKIGYTVFECNNAKMAINKVINEKQKIDICIIDIGLPDINGIKLANELLLFDKDLHILFTSGQDEEELKMQFGFKNTFQLLKKPYRILKLFEKVERFKFFLLFLLLRYITAYVYR